MTNKTTTFEEAKRIAREQKRDRNEHAEESSAESYMRFATSEQLIKMAQTMRDLGGKPFSSAMFGNLVMAYEERFGGLPPGVTRTEVGAASAVPEKATDAETLPADDTMLDMGEVVRLTGLSKSTIKRLVGAGTFPRPLKTSPRRIAWPACEVKAWLELIEEQRTKRRH